MYSAMMRFFGEQGVQLSRSAHSFLGLLSSPLIPVQVQLTEAASPSAFSGDLLTIRDPNPSASCSSKK